MSEINREICRAVGCRYSIAPCVTSLCIHRTQYKPVEALIASATLAERQRCLECAPKLDISKHVGEYIDGYHQSVSDYKANIGKGS